MNYIGTKAKINLFYYVLKACFNLKQKFVFRFNLNYHSIKSYHTFFKYEMKNYMLHVKYVFEKFTLKPAIRSTSVLDEKAGALTELSYQIEL